MRVDVKTCVKIAAAALVGAAVVWLFGAMSTLALDQREQCRMAVGPAFLRPSATDPVERTNRAFPLSASCTWPNDGRHIELVPAYVNVLLIGLLTTGVTLLGLAVQQTVAGRRRSRITMPSAPPHPDDCGSSDE